MSSLLLPIIPLKEIVVFPNSITPLFIVRHRSLQALEGALAQDKAVFLVTQKNVEEEHPGLEDLYEVGCVAGIVQVLRLPDGSAKILVEGRYPARIVRATSEPSYMTALVEEIHAVEERGKEIEALRRTVEKQFETYVQLSDKVPEDLAVSIRSLDDAVPLANAITNYCHFRAADKQRVLEARRASEKLLILSQLFTAENELLELENKIITQVKAKIGKSQKEYFLNEQLKIIEKELGVGGEEDVELEEYDERLKKSKMSEEAREKAYRELNRLARMAQLSPEATVSRTYIEWLLDLPWGKYTKDQEDLERAQKILDEDHFGLVKVKERIVEHLAVLKLVKEMKGPILCLVGPPGVGKTSLARSIARTLKRRFVRVSLGGVRDEAEIRGHRRTYIGSLPGKIIQSIKKAGSMNPVFLLDEIDKMNSDFRGDPASALLEVLDPEQNRTFADHYLEVDFDLSRVMFITTANTTGGIPPPLLDRMELIRLPGYTEDEKRKIARGFLIPRQLKAHGLIKKKVRFEDEAVDTIIQRYTREAGVRNLEREIATLCRKTARRLIAGGEESAPRITPQLVRALLGPERHHDLQIHDKTEVGVATGLAWTDAGGEILPTETTTMPGKGNLQLTGKLGEVMKESGQAALSYLRSRSGQYGLAPDFHKELDIHVHIPEGAIPKDGPSAGVTLVTSMYSALTGRPVRQDVAMTGEITLRGKVLKIGGLKEKVIAAHRNHLRTVLIPADNEPELEEIASEILRELDIRPVRTVDEVLALALADEPARPDKSGGKPRRGQSGRGAGRRQPARGLGINA
ncbi:MAG: Lon protease [candidate division BRC1 bacterium ADurb.BinA292]|nr:MAG: Lon protease [candidate division BRC1 bacterium ADurb.BinA292]